MKAFIHKIENGRDKIGTDNSFVTNNYKNIHNLIMFAFRKVKVGEYHVEAFSDWCNRYRDADFDLVVSKLFNGRRNESL